MFGNSQIASEAVPILSIVAPFWLAPIKYISRIPQGNPPKGTTLETIGGKILGMGLLLK